VHAGRPARGHAPDPPEAGDPSGGLVRLTACCRPAICWRSRSWRSRHVPLQIVLLGALFAGIALLSDSAWALAAGTARAWISRSPRRLSLIGGTGGLVMIGIGTSLAFTGRKD
jgi:hypothetical protein